MEMGIGIGIGIGMLEMLMLKYQKEGAIFLWITCYMKEDEEWFITVIVVFSMKID